MKKIIFILLPLVFVACAKPDSNNLEEVKKREVEVENENLRKKAETLEADLERKQRFFSAIEGEFEGQFSVNDKVFATRMTFVPSLPPYQSGRTRTLDEITADLNNLHFTIQTNHMNTQSGMVVAGCIFSQIRPDYDGGRVNAASENCSNIYVVSFFSSERTPKDLPHEKPGVPQKSQGLAEKVLKKQITKIDEIFVEMKPTLTENSFLMVLRRVQK